MDPDVVGERVISSRDVDLWLSAGGLGMGHARKRGGAAQQDGCGHRDDIDDDFRYYVAQNLS